MSPPSQAADLMAPFATWLGRWEGEGRGLWEAELPFRYRETLAILASGDLSHFEVGFLRLLPDQLVELMVVVPAGYVEIHTGRLQDGALVLTPQTISGSPTARPLRLVQRTLELNHDLLRNAVGIAVGNEEVSKHVESWLQRAAPTS